MTDVNYSLRTAYFAALNAVLGGINVYSQMMPRDKDDDEYLVVRSITSNDVSTKSSDDTSTTVTVEIHTHKPGTNSERRAEEIAALVYTAIRPYATFNLLLNGMQCLVTTIQSDATNDFNISTSNVYIDRFITFRHLIFIDGTSGQQPTIAQVKRIEFTSSGSNFVESAELVNKNILLVSADGTGFSKILTSGIPVNKQVVYNSVSGRLTFEPVFEDGTEIYALYQNN